MLQNSKGFYLVDALVGFSIFILVLSSMMPILYRIYLERDAVLEERFAIGLLDNRLQEWLADNTTELKDEVVTNRNVNYHLGWTQQGIRVELCITWQAKNKRTYEMCGNAK